MIEHKIIPFQQFVESLHAVKHKDLMEKASFANKTNDVFEEMRQHLTDYYKQVESTHSFRDHTRQVWDCVPINKQPAAFRHKEPPAKPRAIPGKHTEPQAENLHRSAFTIGEEDEEDNPRACPEGCVPIRRLTLDELGRFHTLQDYFRKTPGRAKPMLEVSLAMEPDNYRHLHAHGYQWIDNLGGRSSLNIWNPTVNGQDEVFSLSQDRHVGGEGDVMQTVETGWQVWSPEFHGNGPCLFTYWTADNYNNTGAYNGADGNFMQVSHQWAPGQPLSPSTAGGNQSDMDIAWCLLDGKWWLYVNGIDAQNAVGYYHATLYGAGPLSQSAQLIDYGGEVCDLQSIAPMGSGLFPAAGYKQSAYQRNIYCFTANGNNPTAALQPEEGAHNCFQIEIANSAA
ncbi:MAG: hypothetical protein JWR09_5476 [Mucilaginibacter sp.]|nr:hypothetical protein [Mucilaginibacter sp.]